jgi:Arc/MetJ-type ribon-helix-helix transcriptional regulator
LPRNISEISLTNKPEPATARVNDEEPHPLNATVSAVSLMLYDMYTNSYELMAMTVVPIRLSRQDARKLDLLVKLGLYNSRTEAMRAMIQAAADEQLNRYMLNDRVREALNELLQAEKRHGENPLHIASKKTAAEIVAESRQ